VTWARRSPTRSSPTRRTWSRPEPSATTCVSALRRRAATPSTCWSSRGSSRSSPTPTRRRWPSRRRSRGAKSFERALAELGRPFGWHDFSQYDLDAPFPEVSTAESERSFRTQAEGITRLARENNLTLRQVVEHQLNAFRSPFVGSAQTVADEIERWFVGGGFDGINISVNSPAEFARFIEQVLPILRERGVVRSEYESTTLRGNLGLPIPANRHTAAGAAGIEDDDTAPAHDTAATDSTTSPATEPALLS
jgi:hypothetical protein